jgi:RNA polymerase sigma-70 factor (ECF subfamily)
MGRKDVYERELVERLNAREEAAIEEIFHRYYGALCLFCNKITADKEAAKDIVQEIFARLFEKKQYRYENLIAVKTFLYNSVRNGAIDYLRFRDKSHKADVSNLFLMTSNDAEMEMFKLESDIISKIFETIERLPEACRTVFKMSYLDRMSIHDIAVGLNISENTVKTQRQRAKEHLRKWLKDIYPVVVMLFF